MKITEVRVKLLEGRSDRLRAFCSITIDNELVVHDLRVIEGRKGFFVAMPSRKLSDNCPRCGAKNNLKSKFCAGCGAKLDEGRALKGPQARDKFHVDVAHPINAACRELVQSTVLAAYKEELKRREAGLAPVHPYSPDELVTVGEEYEEAEEAAAFEEHPEEAREHQQPESVREEPEELEQKEKKQAGGFGQGIL